MVKDFTALLARRERTRRKLEERREALSAAGMCTRCGERPPEIDRRWCEPCLAWGRAYQTDINQTHRVLPGDRRTRREAAE